MLVFSLKADTECYLHKHAYIISELFLKSRKSGDDKYKFVSVIPKWITSKRDKTLQEKI